MLSQQLDKLITDIEATATSATQREAAADLRESLSEAAQRQACLRCAKAGFVVVWHDASKDVEKHVWYPALTACGAHHTLPRDEQGFELLMPQQFYCTAETSGTPAGGSFDDLEVPLAVRAADREQMRERPSERIQQYPREGL